MEPFHLTLCLPVCVAVTVKWKGKSFPMTLDTSESASTFKSQLFSLTGVPPEKQKIMVKGGMLKDDQDWSKLPLKNVRGTAFNHFGG